MFPCWRPVVRPYFWTARPIDGDVIEELGAPYPSEGVAVSTSFGVVNAKAASIVFVVPGSNRISWYE
jgi:hypothetical protein